MIRIQTFCLVVALAVSIMFLAATAKAKMTGTAVVPPTENAASGTAEVSVDTTAKTVI